jgi:hypothetical protein
MGALSGPLGESELSVARINRLSPLGIHTWVIDTHTGQRSASSNYQTKASVVTFCTHKTQIIYLANRHIR